jgi:hypothetical protein
MHCHRQAQAGCAAGRQARQGEAAQLQGTGRRQAAGLQHLPVVGHTPGSTKVQARQV